MRPPLTPPPPHTHTHTHLPSSPPPQFETLRKEGQMGMGGAPGAPRIYSDSVTLSNIELSTSD